MSDEKNTQENEVEAQGGKVLFGNEEPREQQDDDQDVEAQGGKVLFKPDTDA